MQDTADLAFRCACGHAVHPEGPYVAALDLFLEAVERHTASCSRSPGSRTDA